MWTIFFFSCNYSVVIANAYAFNSFSFLTFALDSYSKCERKQHSLSAIHLQFFSIVLLLMWLDVCVFIIGDDSNIDTNSKKQKKNSIYARKTFKNYYLFVSFSMCFLLHIRNMNSTWLKFKQENVKRNEAEFIKLAYVLVDVLSILRNKNFVMCKRFLIIKSSVCVCVFVMCQWKSW